MSAAPRTAVPEPTRDQISFCRQLFAGMTGAKVELSTIDGDPKDHNNHIWKYGTRRYTSPADLARAIAERAAAGLNVYTSVSASTTRGPRYAPTIDSPVIFVDDAPERGPIPWSMYVQTSPDSGHGYIILDTPIPADARVRLARRLAAACGGDPSGVDAQQLVRPPGSVNGKAKCKGYRAWLKIDSGKRYTIAEVEAATPEVATRAPRNAGPAQIEVDKYIATLDFDDIETRRANIEQLICPDNYPWRFTNPHGQSRQVLTGELGPKNFPLLRKPDDGSYDPSMARAVTIRGQIFHGYADPDIWAMQLHWRHFEHLGGSSAKGTIELKRDIARLILRYRAELAHITPTPIEIAAHKPAQPLPEAPRRRKGRPRQGSADEYLDWLAANVDSTGRVMWTRRECAEHWQVSPATVDRWEANLRERDLMERHTSKDRRYSWIVLSDGVIKNTPEPAADVPEPVLSAPETAPEVLAETPRIMDAHAQEEKHAPPVAPAPEPPARGVFPTLAAAMREAFDAYDGARASWRRVAHYLDANYPGADWTPEALRWWYDRERDERQRRRAFQRQVDELRTLTQRNLTRRDRWCQRLLSADPNGPDGAKYRLACALQPHIAAELERRAPALDRVKPHRRRPSSAPAEAAPPGEQLTLAPGPMVAPEAAPIPAACVSPLPAAGDAEQVKPRLADDYVRAVAYCIDRGDLANAWRIVDLNSGRYNCEPERARLSAAGPMNYERTF